MLLHHKIVGAGEGKQWSQLNTGRDKGIVDFRKGGKRGAETEPHASPGCCGEGMCVVSHWLRRRDPVNWG